MGKSKRNATQTGRHKKKTQRQTPANSVKLSNSAYSVRGSAQSTLQTAFHLESYLEVILYTGLWRNKAKNRVLTEALTKDYRDDN